MQTIPVYIFYTIAYFICKFPYDALVVTGTIAEVVKHVQDENIITKLLQLSQEIEILKQDGIKKIQKDELAAKWSLVKAPWLPPKSYKVIDDSYRWTIDKGLLLQQRESYTHCYLLITIL